MQISPALRSEDHHETLDLGNFDLNLLLVLSTLLRCRNITHAGNELRLSQPATSRALVRLREIFNDELLIRNNRSFELTPLAEALLPKVRSALGNIDKVFSKRILTPERFTVAMPDHIALLLSPKLTAYFRELSEMTVFLPMPRLTNVLPEIESGGVDLALGIAEDAPPGFFCRSLPPIPTLCLARKGHPALQGIATSELGNFLSLRIGQPHYTGFGEIYDGLEPLRPRATETFTVPDIHTAANFVHDTNALLVLPAPSATLIAGRFNLETLIPRDGALPFYQISLIWHERSHRNSINAAVRSMVAAQMIEGKTDRTQRNPLSPAKTQLDA